MSNTTKQRTDRDSAQTLQYSFNDVNSTIGVDGFLVGMVGRKITQTIGTTTVANDTETFSYYDGTTLLYTIQVIYTDGSRTTMLSATRIA